MSQFSHITVLLNETVDALALSSTDLAIDCTAGGGGHSSKILEKLGEGGQLFAFDQDPEAINHLQERFSQNPNIQFVHKAFSNLSEEVQQRNLQGKIQGIIADIGVSSHQIDQEHRGFSFRFDGPLDMRMNPQGSQKSAAEWINTAEERELAEVFFKFGQEPKSRFVAQAICQHRQHEPITRTLQLADIVSKSIHYKKKSRKHPATKVFQAIRIFINDELGQLETLLESGFEALKPGGRMAIITFHSLEDRIVKRFFKMKAQPPSMIPSRLPIREVDLEVAPAKIIRPFPISPSDQEIEINPRSRSARLRVLEKQ